MLRLANVSGEPADRASEQCAAATRSARAATPPVRITVGPDGKLIISSQDAQALDLLESLAAEMPVPHKAYQIFHLKYALASSVAMNLEDFFKEKKDKDQNPWFFFDDTSQNDTSDDRRLSNRRKLKFISDIDTNTILVDVPDSSAAQDDRRTDRDLRPAAAERFAVGPQDRVDSAEVLQGQGSGRHGQGRSTATCSARTTRPLPRTTKTAAAGEAVINFNGSDTDSNGMKTPRFKGLLSIGVDETSNSLLLSAPAFLFDHVSRMIGELDKAAAPEYEVRVVQIGPGISAERVRDLFEQVYNNKQPEKPAEKPPVEKRPSGKSPQRSKSGGNGKSQPEHQESGEKKEAG